MLTPPSLPAVLTGPAVRQREAALGLRGLQRLLWRRRAAFVTVFAVVAAACLAAALAVPRQYTAQVNLKIDPNQRGALDAQVPPGGMADAPVIDTETAVMTSREVARRVALLNGLAADPELAPAAHGLTGEAALDAVAGAALKQVAAARQGQTYIVGLQYRSRDAAKAARLANAFADEYLAVSQEMKTRAAVEQSQLLAQRLEPLGAQVRAADAEIARYRAGAGIVAGSADFGTVTDQQIAGVAQQLALADAEAAQAGADSQAAQAQTLRLGAQSVSQVLASPVVADLRRQRADVVRDQGRISARYGPQHPESIRVDKQLRELDQQIQDESQRVVAGLSSQARAAAARAAVVRAELNRLRGQQSANARAGVQADSLQRDADAKRAIYNQINQAAQQAAQQAQVGLSQARIVSRAVAPAKPSFPNRALFAVLGLILGLVSGTAAVFALEAFDHSLRTARQVETQLGLPVIAAVPALSPRQVGKRRRPWDYVVFKPMSAFAEALRGVKSALAVGRPQGEAKVLAVTSALPGEGKSTTAVALARVLAMGGERVLLIDGDLRRGALRDAVPFVTKAGLLEVLYGAAVLDQTVAADGVEGLDILPLAQSAFTPRDVFGGEAMSTLLAQARGRYDRIILDAPPALALNDGRALAALADQVLLVVRWGRTPGAAAAATLEALRKEGARPAGVILTQVDTGDRAQLAEGDASYYYKAYRAYYVE